MRAACRALLTLAACTVVLDTAAAEPKRSKIEEWFPHLRPGMWVKVEGSLAEDGTLHATEIKIVNGDLDEWEVTTNIAEIDVMHMTLETTFGVRVVATARTEVEGPRKRRRVSFTFLEVGDRVETEGQLQKNGTLLAEEIEIKKSKKLKPDLAPKNEHEVTARIESIDPDQHRIVLMGIPVAMDQETRNKTPLLD